MTATVYIYFVEGLPVLTASDPSTEISVVRELRLPNDEGLRLALQLLSGLDVATREFPAVALNNGNSVFKIVLGEGA